MKPSEATRRAASAALREMVKAADEQAPQDVLTPELFAFATDAVNLLLARAGFPAELRGYLDALIGASLGKLDWFECSDFELGKRMMGTDAGGKSRQAVTKRVQRARNGVNEWQYTNSFIVVESMPGGKDKEGRLHCSKYRLNILAAAVSSVESASAGGILSQRGLKEATKNNLQLISQTGVSRRERFNRPRNDPQAIASRNIKTALTLLEKAAQLIVLAGDDPAFKFAPVLETVERLSNHFTASVDPIEHHDTASSPQSMYGGVHTNTTYRSMDAPVYSPQGPENSAQLSDSDKGREQPQGASSESRAARRDMELFASVGAELCDITTTDESKRVCEFEQRVEMVEAIERVSSMVDYCNRGNVNLIVRPRCISQRVELIPLDDLPQAALKQVEGVAFRCIETSPGNYQAWIAVAEASYGLGKRLKKALGSDLGANGSSRIAGSRNVKPQHIKAWGAAPLVRIVAARPGLVVAESQLESLGAGEAEKDSPPVVAHRRNRPLLKPSSWPAYEHGRLDRSNEDYHYVHKAYEHGWHFWPDDIVCKLMELSDKAQSRGIRYARMVVRNALQKHGLQIEFEN